MGFGFLGLGFGVRGSRFRVWGLWIHDYRLGVFGAWGLGFEVKDLGFGVWG